MTRTTNTKTCLRILSSVFLAVLLLAMVLPASLAQAGECNAFVRKAYSAPLEKQQKPYTCGPACLLSWLKSVGVHSQTEQSLEKILQTNENHGTSYADFVEGLGQLGYAAVFKDEQSVENLQKIFERGYGIIVSTQILGEGHWALLVDISKDGNTLTLMDPWYANKGYRVVSRSEFERDWFDYFGEKKEFKERGIIVVRPTHARR